MQQKRNNKASRRSSDYRRNRTGRRILSIVLLASVVLLILLLTRKLLPDEWFPPVSPAASANITASTELPADSATNALSPSASSPVPTSQSPPPESAAPSQNPDFTAPASADPTPSAAPETLLRTPGHENMPDFGTVASQGNLGTLEKKVRDMVSAFPGTYGVTFVNLATGERFGVNDTQEYIAASTSKFPMNVLLWKRIAAGEINPEAMLTYKQEDFESGTGIIQNEPFGTEFSVRTTSEYSVIHSDNCGINMIIRLLDIEDIRQYLRDLGGVVEYGKTHRSCPADMANVAVDLYRFYCENPFVAGELIDFLEHTDWNDRINGLLPKEVRVAHKIGNQTRTANDVGIIFASQPYVLSVMTDKVDFDTACRNIAKLSKMIYDHLEEQP